MNRRLVYLANLLFRLFKKSNRENLKMAQFPEPPKLDILEIGVPDNNVGKYTLTNPHPDYNKDPNIINQLGHTLYPKWVDSKIEGKRIVVNNPMEEAQHTGEEVKAPEKPKSDGWS